MYVCAQNGGALLFLLIVSDIMKQVGWSLKLDRLDYHFFFFINANVDNREVLED